MKEIPINAEVYSITEHYFYDNGKGYGCTYDGLIINTNKGEINSQQCCEEWGYELDFDKNLDYYKHKYIQKMVLTPIDHQYIIVIEIFFNENEKIFMTIFNYHFGSYPHEYLIEVFDKIVHKDEL